MLAATRQLVAPSSFAISTPDSSGFRGGFRTVILREIAEKEGAEVKKIRRNPIEIAGKLRQIEI